MHLPDGFLDTKTLVATGALSTAGLAASWYRVRSQLPQQRIPLLGVTAAFVFAAQMLNFPVAAGTSGHLMGAVLLSVLLGPYAAIVAMSAVLLVQCFMFADGGILALGANIFNMAIVGVATGYPLFLLMRKLLPAQWGLLPSAAIASWVSIVASALCCAGELAWSGTAAWDKTFAAMGSIHALIGIGESAITCLVLEAIKAARPDLLDESPQAAQPGARFSTAALGVVSALGLVLFLSPFASTWPDGLESVGSTLGFSQRALESQQSAHLFSEYAFPGITSAPLGTIIAGTMGVIVVALVGMVFAQITKRKA
jgi:cobalt/nickel transport system permease protein